MSSPGGERQVVFVSSHAQLGGSELFLERLVRGLGRQPGPVVSLADGPLVARLREAGTEVRVVRVGTSPLAALAGAARLRKHLPAGVVVHANGVKAAVVCALADVGRRDRRIVWHKHDFSLDGAVGRWVARRCARIVGVSAAVLRALPAGVATEVVAPGIVVEPVDRPGAATVTRRILGIAPSRRVVLLVGRLDAAKGHRDVLEAMPEVRRAVPDAVLAFVGGDEPTQPGFGEELRGRVESLGLGGAVIAIGHREDARTLIAGADVVVIASRPVARSGMGQEGFGLVGVEALAAGTPVVAYAAGAVPDVLGPAALLVPAGDRVALGAAITRVLTDSALRAELAAAGQFRVRDRYDIGRTVTAMREIYRQVEATLGGA